MRACPPPSPPTHHEDSIYLQSSTIPPSSPEFTMSIILKYLFLTASDYYYTEKLMYVPESVRLGSLCYIEVVFWTILKYKLLPSCYPELFPHVLTWLCCCRVPVCLSQLPEPSPNLLPKPSPTLSPKPSPNLLPKPYPNLSPRRLVHATAISTMGGVC